MKARELATKLMEHPNADVEIVDTEYGAEPPVDIMYHNIMNVWLIS